MDAIDPHTEQSDPKPDEDPVNRPNLSMSARPKPSWQEQPIPSTPATSASPSPVVNAPKPVVSEPVITKPETIKEVKKTSVKTTLPARERGMRSLWTIGSILSILLNIILLVILLVVVSQLFQIKKLVGDDLVGGLYANFVKMDTASIKTTITVKDNIPVSFDLPIAQNTNVVLSQDTFISSALVRINTGGVSINAPADITLPAGTTLPIRLEMTVPVQTTIPVTLNVPVDIPLGQTELHEPFKGLQDVVAPYYWMLKPDWKTCQDAPIISKLGPACKFFFSSPYNNMDN